MTGTTAPNQPGTERTARGSAWRVAVPAVTVMAGLIFGISAVVAQEEGAAGRPTDLPSLVRERTLHVEELNEQTHALQEEVDALSAARTPADERRLQADILAPVVGAAPVRGPGLGVTLDDAGYSLDTLPEGYTVDDVVVHEQDVQAVINALWAGGAEALMVQDQRIVASSSVRCVGNTLYLQGRVYSPPYTIQAIGDVDGMRAALAADPVLENYRNWARLLGLGYQVEPLGEVDFPAFTGSTRPQYVSLIEDFVVEEWLDVPEPARPTTSPEDEAPDEDERRRISVGVESDQ